MKVIHNQKLTPKDFAKVVLRAMKARGLTDQDFLDGLPRPIWAAIGDQVGLKRRSLLKYMRDHQTEIMAHVLEPEKKERAS